MEFSGTDAESRDCGPGGRAAAVPASWAHPIVSPDGQWVWTGSAWIAWPPVNAARAAGHFRSRQPIGLRTLVLGAVWLVLLVAWAPALYIVAVTGNLANKGWPVVRLLALALAVVAVFATVGFGWHLSTRHRPLPEVLIAAAVGACALISLYVIAWLAVPDSEQSNDNAAGAGLVLLGPPVLLILIAILGAGTVAGRAVARRADSRRRRPATDSRSPSR